MSLNWNQLGYARQNHRWKPITLRRGSEECDEKTRATHLIVKTYIAGVFCMVHD